MQQMVYFFLLNNYAKDTYYRLAFWKNCRTNSWGIDEDKYNNIQHYGGHITHLFPSKKEKLASYTIKQNIKKKKREKENRP